MQVSDGALSYIEALSHFRDTVRRGALDKGDDARHFLAFCDRIRDEVLPELGVRLEDSRANESTVIKVASARGKDSRRVGHEEMEKRKARAREEGMKRKMMREQGAKKRQSRIKW